MSEFETTGTVILELDQQSKRDIKREAENLIAGVPLPVHRGGSQVAMRSDGGASTAGLAGGAAAVDELSEQTDYLDDILNAIEDGGGGLGAGGAGGSGGGGGLAEDYVKYRGVRSILPGGGGGGGSAGRGALGSLGRYIAPIAELFATRELGEHIGGEGSVPDASEATQGENLWEQAGSVADFLVRGSGIPAGLGGAGSQLDDVGEQTGLPQGAAPGDFFDQVWGTGTGMGEWMQGMLDGGDTGPRSQHAAVADDRGSEADGSFEAGPGGTSIATGNVQVDPETEARADAAVNRVTTEIPGGGSEGARARSERFKELIQAGDAGVTASTAGTSHSGPAMYVPDATATPSGEDIPGPGGPSQQTQEVNVQADVRQEVTAALDIQNLREMTEFLSDPQRFIEQNTNLGGQTSGNRGNRRR